MSRKDSYLNKPLPNALELKELLDSNKHLLFMDVGACEGLDSIKYKQLFPNSYLIAFEPVPENFDKIKDNFKTYNINHVQIEKIALSNENGTTSFNISSGHPENIEREDGWEYGNKQSSMLDPHLNVKRAPWLKFRTIDGIEMRRLDAYCKQNKIDHIDFIHMDVQGAELKVLEGAGDMLRSIDIIWMEVGNIEMYRGQPLKGEIENFMQRNGFIKVKDMVKKAAYGDQLYVNAKMLNWKNRLKLKLNQLLK